MKKVWLLSAMLLLIVLVVSGCKAPEPIEEEPQPTEMVTNSPPPEPTWTPEPTITPRPLLGEVERADASATPILIDPIDKPTRPPVIFDPYVEYISNNLNIKFEVPQYWQVTGDEPGSGTLVFSEPAHDIRSGQGAAASVVVAVSNLSAAQTENDASAAIDQIMNELRNEYETLETSSKADNSMLGQKGKYVTYWIDQPIEGQEKPLRMRGRCLVVPVNNKLYMLRYLCPAEYNSDYIEVFYKIRSTIAEL